MNRDALRIAAVAFLGILALSAAAATLDSAVDTTGTGTAGDGGFSLPSPETPDREGSGPQMNGSGAPLAFQGLCIQFLNSPAFLLAVLLVAVVVGVVLARRHGIAVVVALYLAVGIPGYIVHRLLTSCGYNEVDVDLPSVGPPNASQGSNFSLPFQGGGERGFVPTSVLLVVLAIVLAAVAAFFLYSGRRSADAEDRDVASVPDPDALGAIGETAGEAADRIERQADVDNEVYRAWREMTAHLDVANPAASTPGEFREAAVAAGMAPGDVGDLTALFEEVRYGGADPTEERERRALAALRRIEDAYAPDGDEAERGGEDR